MWVNLITPHNGYIGASIAASYYGNNQATIPASSNAYMEPPYLPHTIAIQWPLHVPHINYIWAPMPDTITIT
jgi:hypothetical protein